MQYPDQLKIKTQHLNRGIKVSVPGSKSLTNRAVIAAALCDAPVVLKGVLQSEDTELASEAISTLGASVVKENNDWKIDGRNLGKVDGHTPDVFLGNSGTSVRFLSSVLCAKGISCRITGTKRMEERPIELLIQALTDLGGDIKSVRGTGCPPLKIGEKTLEGGETHISGQVSSQYFSGLMLAAPLAQRDSKIYVSDQWLSMPYIVMTQKMLAAFGISMELNQDHIHIFGEQKYKSPGIYHIEPDASAATYPLALAVLHGVCVELQGLGTDSLQGDVRFVKVLEKMGCQIELKEQSLKVQPGKELLSIEEDLNDIPDAAMTVTVLCTVAKGTSRLTGLKNLAFKECDRLRALETELSKMGVDIEADEDGFTIHGSPYQDLRGASIETYKDHRVAMCLSLLGTLVPETVILDPSCVQKTYPNYWQDLKSWQELGA